MSPTINRFRISYRDGSYRVSLPGYPGGEVVRAEHYDNETSKMLRTLRLIAKLHSATPQRPEEMARALFQASAAAQAIVTEWE